MKCVVFRGDALKSCQNSPNLASMSFGNVGLTLRTVSKQTLSGHWSTRKFKMEKQLSNSAWNTGVVSSVCTLLSKVFRTRRAIVPLSRLACASLASRVSSLESRRNMSEMTSTGSPSSSARLRRNSQALFESLFGLSANDPTKRCIACKMSSIASPCSWCTKTIIVLANHDFKNGIAPVMSVNGPPESISPKLHW